MFLSTVQKKTPKKTKQPFPVSCLYAELNSPAAYSHSQTHNLVTHYIRWWLFSAITIKMWYSVITLQSLIPVALHCCDILGVGLFAVSTGVWVCLFVIGLLCNTEQNVMSYHTIFQVIYTTLLMCTITARERYPYSHLTLGLFLVSNYCFNYRTSFQPSAFRMPRSCCSTFPESSCCRQWSLPQHQQCEEQNGTSEVGIHL